MSERLRTGIALTFSAAALAVEADAVHAGKNMNDAALGVMNTRGSTSLLLENNNSDLKSEFTLQDTDPLAPNIIVASSTPPANVNYRASCSTGSEVAGTSDGRTPVEYVAKANGDDGHMWYITSDGACVREDVAGNITGGDSLIILNDLEGLTPTENAILNLPVIDNKGEVVGTVGESHLNISELNQVVNHFIDAIGFQEKIFSPENMNIYPSSEGYLMILSRDLTITEEAGDIVYPAGSIFTWNGAKVGFFPTNIIRDGALINNPDLGEATGVDYSRLGSGDMGYEFGEETLYFDWAEGTNDLYEALTDGSDDTDSATAVAKNLFSPEEMTDTVQPNNSGEIGIDQINTKILQPTVFTNFENGYDLLGGGDVFQFSQFVVQKVETYHVSNPAEGDNDYADITFIYKKNDGSLGSAIIRANGRYFGGENNTSGETTSVAELPYENNYPLGTINTINFYTLGSVSLDKLDQKIADGCAYWVKSAQGYIDYDYTIESCSQNVLQLRETPITTREVKQQINSSTLDNPADFRDKALVMLDVMSIDPAILGG